MKTTIMRELSTAEIERVLSRESVECPGCDEYVRTRPAEGIAAQILRSCNECREVFEVDFGGGR